MRNKTQKGSPLSMAVVALLLALALGASAQQLNNEPVIGIFTQPYGSTPLPAYFPASYVKYLESAGARVV